MAAAVTIESGATWQEVVADRQKYRDITIEAVKLDFGALTDIPLNTVPFAKTLLTAGEVKITESTVEILAKQLANSEVSAVEVAKAFLRRAVLAQKLVLFFHQDVRNQTNRCCRRTVLLKSSMIGQLNERSFSMSTWRRTVNHLGFCMEFQSV